MAHDSRSRSRDGGLIRRQHGAVLGPPAGYGYGYGDGHRLHKDRRRHSDRRYPPVNGEVAPWDYPGKLHRWESPTGVGYVDYKAKLVDAPRAESSSRRSGPFPVAFYFSGLGENPDEAFNSNWNGVAPEPFILIAPSRPKKKWWFIDNDSSWGWVQGEFIPELCDLYCNWLCDMSRHVDIDSGRVGLFGFSAGAYACVEVLAAAGRRSIFFRGVGLGGVHGHGQSDIENLPAKCSDSAVSKWNEFILRLRNHPGADWIQVTHGKTDQQSRWKEASAISLALDDRQLALGHSSVSIRVLNPEEQDITPGKKKNKAHHSYFNVAFQRREFLVNLFGGSAPQPGWRNVREVMNNSSNSNGTNDAPVSNIPKYLNNSVPYYRLKSPSPTVGPHQVRLQAEPVDWGYGREPPQIMAEADMVYPPSEPRRAKRRRRRAKQHEDAEDSYDEAFDPYLREGSEEPVEKSRIERVTARLANAKVKVEEAKKESDETKAALFEWDAASDMAKKRKWRAYDEGVQKKLLAAYAQKMTSLEIEIEGFWYTIDFTNMQQFAQHSGFVRRIRFGEDF